MLMRFFFLLRGFSQGARELRGGRSRDIPHGLSSVSYPGGRAHRTGLQLPLLQVALTACLPPPQGSCTLPHPRSAWKLGTGSTGLGAAPCPWASPPGLPAHPAEDGHSGAHQREGERKPELLSKNLAEPLSHLVSGAELWPLLCLSASQGGQCRGPAGP